MNSTYFDVWFEKQHNKKKLKKQKQAVNAILGRNPFCKFPWFVKNPLNATKALREYKEQVEIVETTHFKKSMAKRGYVIPPDLIRKAVLKSRQRKASNTPSDRAERFVGATKIGIGKTLGIIWTLKFENNLPVVVLITTYPIIKWDDITKVVNRVITTSYDNDYSHGWPLPKKPIDYFTDEGY